MSLLDNASLLLTPNAVKASKLYSVIPSDGSGDFTFTRATTATRVNSAGLVELVPYNLLSYSEQFNDAIWSKAGGATITANSTTAPDGTLTADTFDTNQTKLLFQNRPALNNTTYTLSVWVKLGTATNLCLIVNNTLSWDTIGGQSFNASNGLNTSTWTRISFTFTTPTLPVNAVNIHLGGNAQSGLVQSSGTVFIWGAQLNEGTNALPYQKTETRLNIPRLDYSLGGCPSLLVEPQRTNTMTYSEDFSNAVWTITNGAIATNTIAAPSNVISADTFTDNSTPGIHTITRSAQWSTTRQTFSIYVKANTLTKCYIANGSTGNAVCFDLSSGTIEGYTAGSGNAMVNASITSLSNGWYRVSATHTATASQTFAFGFYKVFNSSSFLAMATYIGTSQSAYLWGAQLEAGAYATSYIPTTSASVTRNQDLASRTSVSSLIGQTEGTLFCEIKLQNVNSASTYVGMTSGTFANGILIGKEAGVTPNKLVFYIFANGVTILNNTSTALSSSFVKCAIAYKSGDWAAYVNGSLVASGTSTFTFSASVNRFGFGSNAAFAALDDEMEVKQTALWKTRLTNAQLAQLTTL